MNTAFVGTPHIIDTYAKLIQSTINYGSDDAIKLCGVYCSNIEDTTNLAIKLNTKVYMSLDNLINECELIFICYDDKGLKSFTDILKKKRVRGKILSHFNERSNSSKIFAGVTNTCYAISYPYPPVFPDNTLDDKDSDTDIKPKQAKEFNISDFPLIIEGGGKRHEEFESLIKSAFPKSQFVTEDLRRLSYLASRVLRDYLKITIHTAKALYKLAGLYDPGLFSEFCKNTVSDLAPDDKDQTTEKLTENEIRTDIKLISETNREDIQSIYKTMESLIAKTGIYSEKEKETILKILKKR